MKFMIVQLIAAALSTAALASDRVLMKCEGTERVRIGAKHLVTVYQKGADPRVINAVLKEYNPGKSDYDVWIRSGLLVHDDSHINIRTFRQTTLPNGYRVINPIDAQLSGKTTRILGGVIYYSGNISFESFEAKSVLLNCVGIRKP